VASPDPEPVTVSVTNGCGTTIQSDWLVVAEGKDGGGNLEEEGEATLGPNETVT
jgi:hypothetical protein